MLGGHVSVRCWLPQRIQSGLHNKSLPFFLFSWYLHGRDAEERWVCWSREPCVAYSCRVESNPGCCKRPGLVLWSAVCQQRQTTSDPLPKWSLSRTAGAEIAPSYVTAELEGKDGKEAKETKAARCLSIEENALGRVDEAIRRWL